MKIMLEAFLALLVCIFVYGVISSIWSLLFIGIDYILWGTAEFLKTFTINFLVMIPFVVSTWVYYLSSEISEL